MLEVHIRVHKTHCEILKHDIVPNGCVNAVVCYFSFDSFWDGFDMLASFESAYGTYHETIVDGKCSMRNEIIEHASSVRIGVIGVKDDITVTSTMSPFEIDVGANKDGSKDGEYHPTLLEQLLQLMQETQKIAEGVRDDAAAGKFDGKDGVACTHTWNGTTLTVASASGTSSADLKGDKGDKGDDYVLTDADKEEIAGKISEVSVPKSEKNNAVYARYDNKDTTIPFSSGSADPYSMVRRDSRGCIISADPELDNECATKGYTDKKFDDFKDGYVPTTDRVDVVYAHTADGNEPITFSSASCTPFTMVRRDSRGCIISAVPVRVDECATKGYVDKTVYIGLDGYCYSVDGIAYSVTNLDFSAGLERRYNFVLFDVTDSGDTLFQAPLSVELDVDNNCFYLSAIWNYGGVLYSAFASRNLADEEEAIDFSIKKVAGAGLVDNYGRLSVDTSDMRVQRLTFSGGVEDAHVKAINAGYTLFFGCGDIDNPISLEGLQVGGKTSAATREYVDGLIGDVEAVLDNIIALQEAYIGGEDA